MNKFAIARTVTKLALSCAVALATLCSAPRLEAQLSVPSAGYLPKYTNTLTGPAAATPNLGTNPAVSATSSWVAIPANSILVLEITAKAANAGDSNVIFSFATTLSKTNYSSTFPYTATLAMGGSNVWVTKKFVIDTNLTARYISWIKHSIAQTNDVTVGPIVYSFIPYRP